MLNLSEELKSRDITGALEERQRLFDCPQFNDEAWAPKIRTATCNTCPRGHRCPLTDSPSEKGNSLRQY